jgi:hypothetical protein
MHQGFRNAVVFYEGVCLEETVHGRVVGVLL